MLDISDLARVRDDTRALAGRLVADFAEAGAMIATAESCTGGLIAAAITDISGSSAVFDRGFVTYSNQAKTDMLGIDPETLARFGAVSPDVAKEMARGAQARSQASHAVSVTGIAGPGGGSREKPVGLVQMGLAGPNGHLRTVELRWNPTWSRDMIRAVTVNTALEALIDILHGRDQADGWL